MPMTWKALGAAALAIGLTACADVTARLDQLTGVTPTHAMVTAANPLATDAGYRVLERGGSALDAAVAVQSVLTLVEPQSSGLGGGAFLLYWDAGTKTLHAYDGRETAPASAVPELFLKPSGRPQTLRAAIVGGKSVGVPGVVAMLSEAHGEHGHLRWSSLFDDAIRLSDEGFAISPRLAGLVETFASSLKAMPEASRYFFNEDGTPLGAGETLRNPAYAETLRSLAAGGADAFYKGPIAAAISDRVTTAPVNPAVMTTDDLASYEPKEREPVCAPFRVYRVCAMPPPTSGGVTVLQILMLVEAARPEPLKPGTLETIHLVAEAERLAYADRAIYLADPDFVDVPMGLLDPAYVGERAKLIRARRAMRKADAGVPPSLTGLPRYAPHRSPEWQGTTHFSIVDGAGNVASMTSSIEFVFGSQLMAGGFFLNNELTDFSFEPSRRGRPIANAVAAGKRPRSSMAPVIVFDAAGAPILAIGSPGGGNIIGYVAQALIDIFDGGLSLQDALAAPRYLETGEGLKIEKGTALEAMAPRLERLGHVVEITGLTSGLHAIRIWPDRLEGAADPRREGTVAGH